MRASWFAGLAVLALTGCATLSGDAPADRYLAKGAYDARDHLGPPPAKDSPEAEKDRQIFLATRGLKDTPRWSLAQADNVEENVLGAYACALGYTPTRQSNPKLAAMLLRMSRDVRSAVTGPKLKYRRPRPYLSAPGPICVKRSPGLTLSPDYPSGHATWGWSVGLLLAEAAPDRAEAILARARGFGESRVVCGVHNASSVEAGRKNAENLFAALWSSEAFKADLAGVRAELDTARAAATPPDPARCTAEANLIGAPLL
ncbi:phosphatase PAP2 family protein [Caulobacter sp. 1776]|uniref:acid phosphatase n=1 Tax=Caulobacter sp. 1776 TaxID=3156420 RepID=UPI00339B1B04